MDNQLPKMICQICESHDVRPYCRKGPAAYYRCGSCSFIFQYPAPPPASMLSYADAEYVSDGLYGQYVQARDMKIEHFRQRLSALAGRLKKGRLLDIGCSCGYFMEVAASEGYEVHGLEFSENAIAASAPHIRPNIVKASVEQISDDRERSYDVVSAFDIIEHLESPLEFLSQAKRLLNTGGHLVISTPDVSHWLRGIMGERWPMLQPMQHVSLFSPEALRIALKKTGFADIEIAPAYKVLSGDYLIRQLPTLNPLLYKVLSGSARVLPREMMQTWRKINIGEILATATRTE